MSKVSFGAYIDASVLREVDLKRTGSRNQFVEEAIKTALQTTPRKPVEVETEIPSYLRELRTQIFRNLRNTD